MSHLLSKIALVIILSPFLLAPGACPSEQAAVEDSVNIQESDVATEQNVSAGTRPPSTEAAGPVTPVDPDLQEALEEWQEEQEEKQRQRAEAIKEQETVVRGDIEGVRLPDDAAPIRREESEKCPIEYEGEPTEISCELLRRLREAMQHKAIPIIDSN